MLKKLAVAKSILGLVGCSIMLGAMVSSCSNSSPKGPYSIDYISVKMEKDGDWSLMSKDGKIKFENEFKNAPSYVINGLFSVKEGDGYSVYRVDGDKPQLVGGLENLKGVGVLNDGLMPVCFAEHRISVVNGNGEEQFELGPVGGKEIILCNSTYKDKMLYVEDEDGKIGYFNASGECVIAPKYDNGYSFSENKALVLKDSKWSVIDKEGNVLFTFKDGQKPLISGDFKWSKYGRFCARDTDGRYYFYDSKGEITKLNNKIKDLIDFNDKYIIFKSESSDLGLMTIDGEIVIRPKYKMLSFGESGQLLAKRDSKDYELLDYSGEVIAELDYKTVVFFEDFGYLASDGSSATFLDGKGEAVNRNAEFFNLGDETQMGLVKTCFIPSERIVNTVIGMITPTGVDNYKFGEDLTLIAKQKRMDIDSLIRDGSGDVLVKNEFFGGVQIAIAAWSEYRLAYNHYDYYSYRLTPIWNDLCKIDVFNLFIYTNGCWGVKGVTALADAFKKEGFSVEREGSDKKNASILLMKDGRYVFITTTDHDDNTLRVIYYKDINLNQYSEYINDKFKKIGKDDSDDDSNMVECVPVEECDVPVEPVTESLVYINDSVAIVQ